MKPALLLFCAALCCGINVEASANYDAMGRPTPEHYKAVYLPCLFGDTMLPAVLAAHPEWWRNVTSRVDKRGIHFVEWIDDDGRVLCSMSNVTFGGGGGVLELRRADAPIYIATGTVGTVLIRVKKGSAFSVEAGEETPRPECPAIPARVGVVTLP